MTVAGNQWVESPNRIGLIPLREKKFNPIVLSVSFGIRIVGGTGPTANCNLFGADESTKWNHGTSFIPNLDCSDITHTENIVLGARLFRICLG